MKLNYVSHIISKTNIIKYLKWIITFPSYFLSSFQIKFAITWFSMLRLLKSNIYHLFHIIQMLQNPTAQRLQLELPNDQFLNTFKSKVTATNEVIKNFSETAASSIRDRSLNSPQRLHNLTPAWNQKRNKKRIRIFLSLLLKPKILSSNLYYLFALSAMKLQKFSSETLFCNSKKSGNTSDV